MPTLEKEQATLPEQKTNSSTDRLVPTKDLEAAGIPADVLQLDYKKYLKWHDERHAQKLKEIKDQIDSSPDASDPVKHFEMMDWYSKLADKSSREWGIEFDDRMMDYMAGVLIDHKKVAIVKLPEENLYWYNRLLTMIYGLPSNQDSFYKDDVSGQYYQNHPGRPDSASIELYIYDLPDSKAKMGQAALGQIMAPALDQSAELVSAAA
jgi:hypothetical protein